jgi:hypothetical protein
MQHRKSRPNIPSVLGDRDRTQVSPAPTAKAAPLATPNVIPFAKPRAISNLMADNKVTPLFGKQAMPDASPSWGSAAKPQPQNLWAKDMATPPENRKVNANTVAARPHAHTPAPLPPAPLAVAPALRAAPVAAAPKGAPFAPTPVAAAPKGAPFAPGPKAAPVAAAPKAAPVAAAPKAAPLAAAPKLAPAPKTAPAAKAAPASFDTSAVWPSLPANQSNAQTAYPVTPAVQQPPRFVTDPPAFEREAPTFVTEAPAFIPAVGSTPHSYTPTVTEAQSSPAKDVSSIASPSRWAVFEQLGLGAPKLDPKTWTKHVVSAYRMLGFGILTIIVIVLIGYIATTAFFYVSNSWVVPMAISPSDEKVVTLQSQVAAQQTSRDRTAAELDEAERAIVVQQEFQSEFAKAIQSDLDGRKAALDRMHQLANAAASTRMQIRRSNSAYANASQRQMAQEWRAGLIDRQQMLAGKFQVAQISTSNLSLAERQAEYETRAADLEAQTRSLESLLANTAAQGAMSYDVLKIKQEFEASRLETQKAVETRDMLKLALEREDKLLKSLQQSSYLRAVSDHAQVAFVPYGNLTKVEKGAGLYGCRLGMVICHKVGTVLEVLPGEVQFKHPHKDKELRGQMVELKLDDNSAAEDDVLFVGGRPLLI